MEDYTVEGMGHMEDSTVEQMENMENSHLRMALLKKSSMRSVFSMVRFSTIPTPSMVVTP
jgi:hypothetical protein